MHYTIYQTTNLINGKIYIGKHQTGNINDDYLGSGKHLGRALKKHGIENFQKEILFVFDNEDDMNKKEAELVTEEFCARDDTYNICSGGRGGFGYINRLRIDDVEIRKKMNEDSRKALKKARGVLKEKLSSDDQFIKLFGQHMSTMQEEFLSQYNSDMDFRQKHLRHMKDMQTRSQSLEAQARKKESYRRIGHSQGENNSQFGSQWITDGSKNMKISKDLIIPEGWRRGRMSGKQSTK